MFNLGGPDAHCHTAEGTVRAGMRITTNDGHSRQNRPVFRADHMDNTLTQILEREIGQRAHFTNIRVERFHLLARDRVFNAAFPEIGRRVVVRRRDDRRIAPRFALRQSQPLEGLRTRHFMHEVAVNVNQRSTIGIFLHHMALPKFVIQVLRHISATPENQAPVGLSELRIISRLNPTVSRNNKHNPLQQTILSQPCAPPNTGAKL